MGLFYTGKGDRGKSDLGAKKISKKRLEIAVLADLDELNSLLGLIKNQSLGKTGAFFKNVLNNVQEDLFIIQARVGYLMAGGFKAPELKKEKISRLEKIIDGFEKQIKPPRGFIIPGSSPASAWFDLTRAVVRKTELSVLRLKKRLPPPILAYLNRLSGLLYAMARLAAKKDRKNEKRPSYQ